MDTRIPGLSLVAPNPERDAPFAVRWFGSPGGRETLLLMGNPAHAIQPPTLEDEKKRLESFIEMEKTGVQSTWMMRLDGKTIGAVWLDLRRKGTVNTPGMHIMIGDTGYRNKGIGKSVMSAMASYARDVLKAEFLYSRYLVSNGHVRNVMDGLGFVSDGGTYTDEDGLVWQNVKLAL